MFFDVLDASCFIFISFKKATKNEWKYESHSINKGNFAVKSQIHFFSEFLFDKYKHCNVWNWVIAKTILILQNGIKLNRAQQASVS